MIERTRVPQYAQLAALGVAGLITLLLLIAAVNRLDERKRVDALLEAQRLAAAAATQPAPAKTDPDPMVQRISERNVMAPPKATGFQGQLTGILGDQAMFNGSQLAKVGDNVAGAKVVSIGPNWAEIEFEGQTQKLWVFGPSSITTSAAPAPGAGAPGAPRASSAPGAPGGRALSPEQIERFKQMPPEAREQALSRMPPEMAQQLRAQSGGAQQ